MNKIYQHYQIDLSGNNNFVQYNTVQGDGNGVRGFEIELTEKNKPYVPGNDVEVFIAGTKPDTKQIFNSCEVTEQGTILVDVTTQMSAVAGRGYYQIVLISKTTNKQLKSFPFIIYVKESAFHAETITSSNEFHALNGMVNKIESTLNKTDLVDSMLESSTQILEDTTAAYDNALKSLKKAQDAIATAESINSTAQESAENAKQSEEHSALYSNTAQSYAVGTNNEIRENDALDNAKYYKEQAESSSASALQSANLAGQKATDACAAETNTQQYAANAYVSETNAKESEENAAQSAASAVESKTAAEQSALNAKASEKATAESAKNANQNALLAESYFHGGTGIREGEDEENVVALYEKVQAVADLDIATESKAGLVKASDDVHVTTDGTMSIPKLSELENLIKGASSAKVCEDLEDMVTQLNNASLADFTVGTNILIKAVGLPDFWISEVYTENIPYVWTNDEDFINNLHPASSPTENSLQVGYYGISFLETDKVDLTGIAKESYVDQKFTEAQTHSDTNLATAKNYTDNKISGIANTQTPTFLEAETRENIVSGEKLSTIFGKIKKWFSDLKTVAFTGSYNDLTNKPDIPTIPSSLPANGGNADTVDNKHASDFVLKSGKTANRILVTDNNGNVTDGSPIVASELDYLKGIHQNIQNSLTGLENRPNGRMSVYKNDWTTPPGNDGNSNCVMAFIHPDNPYRVDLSSWYKAANGTDTMWCFTVVDRARADVDGNVFSDTYATKSEVSSATIKQELVHIHTGSEGSWSADVNYGSMGYTQIPVAMFLTNRSDNVYNVSYENRDKTLHIVVNRVSGHGGDDYFWIEMIGK